MIYVSFVRVPYAALAKAFSLIEATTKRLEKTSLLTSLFLLVIRRRAKDDIKSLLQTVYLCINRVRGHLILQCISWPFAQLSPDYIGIELGIGESLLIKAIGESTGRGLATIKTDFKKEGDLGLVAMVCWLPDLLCKCLFNALLTEQNSKNSQKTLFKPKPLTVPYVFTNLKDIALSTGHSVRHSNW